MYTKFNDFINESYLGSGRHLLYHYTKIYNFSDILTSDILKTNIVADGHRCISFTRSLTFKEHSSDIRFVFDSDELKRRNYKIIPYDEIGGVISKNKKHSKGYTKANPYSEHKFPRHNIKSLHTPKGNSSNMDEFRLEWEYEERSYKDIKDLGKYIIAIDITEYELNNNLGVIDEYLKKYPHIEITLLDTNKLYDRRNVINFNEYKKVKGKVKEKI